MGKPYKQLDLLYDDDTKIFFSEKHLLDILQTCNPWLKHLFVWLSANELWRMWHMWRTKRMIFSMRQKKFSYILCHDLQECIYQACFTF